jgi:hypothetical protein
VLGISGGTVSLGFETNRRVPVHREEVRERIVASRAREPPVGFAGPTESSGADGSARMLSGTGKGRSPLPSEERA